MAKMPENRCPAENNCKPATYFREDFDADEAPSGIMPDARWHTQTTLFPQQNTGYDSGLLLLIVINICGAINKRV